MSGLLGFGRALAEALKTVGNAVLERLVGDLMRALGAELGARDVRRRHAVVEALREALAQPEHALADEDRARVEAGITSALADGRPGHVLFPLQDAMQHAAWSLLQRFVFLQRALPASASSGTLTIGAIQVGTPPDEPVAGARRPHLALVRSEGDPDEPPPEQDEHPA